MKRILITGANSYVGTSLENWLRKYPDKYFIDTVDMKASEWKEKDFSKYDVAFHVAGIAHVSSDSKMENLYYKVNRDLAIECASKAKSEGVKQFIFMSSIIIYGDSSSERNIINKNTMPKPSNFYGDSKLQAEEGLSHLESDSFKIVIIRPPMIYGKGSKGNYPKLAKIASFLPVFPDIDNQRSMLYIDNLCEFIRFMIKNEESGVFFPQNSDYVKTSELVRLIAEAHGNKIRLVKTFNILLNVLGLYLTIVNKVFGNLVYEKCLSEYKENYQLRDLRESIMATEKEEHEEGFNISKS